MAKEITYTSSWLKVEVAEPFPGIATRTRWTAAAKHLAEQIKRHCDDVASIQIQNNSEGVCQFCGGSWTEDDDIYNGGCCKEDQLNSFGDTL